MRIKSKYNFVNDKMISDKYKFNFIFAGVKIVNVKNSDIQKIIEISD